MGYGDIDNTLMRGIAEYIKEEKDGLNTTYGAGASNLKVKGNTIKFKYGEDYYKLKLSKQKFNI